MIKLVAFDIDGTLVDSDKTIVMAIQQAFVEHGLKKPSKKVILNCVGFPASNWVNAVLRETRAKGDAAALTIRLLQLIRGNFLAFSKRFSVAPTLNLLKHRVKIVVLSNTPEKNARWELKQLGIIKYFDAILAAEQLGAPKPSPVSALKLIQRFKVKKSEVLYVGDSDVDARYARSAGIKLALMVNKRNRKVHRDFSLLKFSNLLQVVEHA